MTNVYMKEQKVVADNDMLHTTKQKNTKDIVAFLFNESKVSDSDLNVAYTKLFECQMSKEQISDYAITVAESGIYSRSAGSAEFVLSRMHVLLYGQAPDGETQNRADTMFAIPKTMIEFVIKQGDLTEEDLDVHLESAKTELLNRPVKVPREVALPLMSNYYKEHKSTLPDNISKSRELIIELIMSGKNAEEAFIAVG